MFWGQDFADAIFNWVVMIALAIVAAVFAAGVLVGWLL